MITDSVDDRVVTALGNVDRVAINGFADSRCRLSFDGGESINNTF